MSAVPTILEKYDTFPEFCFQLGTEALVLVTSLMHALHYRDYAVTDLKLCFCSRQSSMEFQSVPWKKTSYHSVTVIHLSMHTHTHFIFDSLCVPSRVQIFSPPPPPYRPCVSDSRRENNKYTPSPQRAAVQGWQHAALLTDCLPVAQRPALGQRLCYYD